MDVCAECGLLRRYPPFYDENPFGIYEKILAAKVHYPSALDPLGKDLIKKLLVADRTKRFGCMKVLNSPSAFFFLSLLEYFPHCVNNSVILRARANKEAHAYAGQYFSYVAVAHIHVYIH